MKKNLLLLFALVSVLSSCGTAKITRSSQYPGMYEAKPVTLLVMPPINNTTHVEAKEYLYSSITQPLCEAGYYVISPTLAMDVLKAESAYDSELFVDKPLDKFQKFFGVDAVVFSEINSWEKVLSQIKTNIHYFIKNARNGDIIFERTCELYLDLSSNTGSSFIDLVATAIKTVSTEQIQAARKVNAYIFQDIPRGKYSSLHGKDQDFPASDKDIEVVVR